MLKYFLQHIMFAATMFAAGTPALGGGGGSTDGAGAAAPGGSPAGGGAQPTTPGGTPAGGTPQGTPAAGGEGLPQLRTAYEELKAKYEPFSKLDPAQVTRFETVYQKTYTEAAAIGRDLGYPDEEIAEALAEDPVRTMDFLRNQAQQGAQNRQQPDQGRDLNDLVQQHIQQALSPIQERENTRITNEANSLFERTVHGEVAGIFKAEGIDVAQIPQDEMFMITSAASEILKYDDQALHGLKYEGKTAPIQKAVREAVTFLDKYYVARAGRDKARVQPPARPGQQQQQGQPGKRPSLDEIIDNPGVLGKQYA